MKEPALALAATAWRKLPRRLRVAFLGVANHRVAIGTIGLIHDGAGRVLLLEHRFRPSHPWGLPGGYLRRGEAPEEGLRRELLEETGLQIRVETGIIDTEYNIGGGYVAVALVARAEPRPLVLSSEILSGRFFAPEELEGPGPGGGMNAYPWHLELIRKWRIAERSPAE